MPWAQTGVVAFFNAAQCVYVGGVCVCQCVCVVCQCVCVSVCVCWWVGGWVVCHCVCVCDCVCVFSYWLVTVPEQSYSRCKDSAKHSCRCRTVSGSVDLFSCRWEGGGGGGLLLSALSSG